MRTLIVICITVITSFSYAQELMTIGETFSFEVGDKFHYRVSPGSVPPAVDRVTITDKYYSASGDTVFYERYTNSYYAYVIWDPEPHMGYHFAVKTDTVFYTSLDSLLSYYDAAFQCDTSFSECDTNIYYSEPLCNALVNGYYTDNGFFEPEVYIKEYGQGLGWVKDYYYSGSSMPPGVMKDKKMIYYLKNGVECGTPDNLSVSTPVIPGIDNLVSIFPNPAIDYFSVKINTPDRLLDYRIYNIYGALVDAGKWTQEVNRYNLVGFKPGIYIIEVMIDGGRANYKLVVE